MVARYGDKFNQKYKKISKGKNKKAASALLEGQINKNFKKDKP